MLGLVVGQDRQIAAWTFETFKFRPSNFNFCVGIADGPNSLVGGILFQNYNGANVDISVYCKRPPTRGIVRSVTTILIGLNVSRVSLTITKKNKRLIRSAKKFGFQYEGTARRFYGDEDTEKNAGVRLVMFRERFAQILGAAYARHAATGIQRIPGQPTAAVALPAVPGLPRGKRAGLPQSIH